MRNSNTAAVKFVVLVCLTLHSALGTPKHPFIFVPGDGGSQIEVKLNKTSGPHYYCDTHTANFQSLWLNLEEILPGVIDCFVDNMRLEYDVDSRTTRNPAGVHTRIPGFGQTESVEWLDPSVASHLTSAVSYFHPIVDALVSKGYERGVNLRGAPFDFRKAPNELGDYFKALQNLIEDTYKLNNGSKVIAVGHSLGNPTFLYFLNHQPQAWKDKFMQSFVSLAGVWGGAFKPMRLFTSGDSLGIFIVNPIIVRKEQRAMPSTAFLMPSDKFWSASEPFIITDKKNYTVNDYQQFFQDINYTNGWLMRQDTWKLIYDLTAPGVAVHCLHGIDVPTPAKMIFGPGDFPNNPKTIMGQGDGTVNIQSLLGCLRWTKQQSQPVKHMTFTKVDHMEILADEKVVSYVVDIALGKR